MKICLIQLNSQNNKTHNLDKVEQLVSHAMQHDNPDIITLPEMFNFVGGTKDEKDKAAEQLNAREPSPTYLLMGQLAKRYKVVIHAGSMREHANGKTYNTTVIFGKNGMELAQYRKIHLFDAVTPDGKEYKESASYDSGSQIVTYQLNGINIGCAICYDLRFAELFIELFKRQVEVIIIPSAFTFATGQAHWEVLLRARAIETQSFIVAPAQTGNYQENGEEKKFWGHSMAIDPWGNILADLGTKEGYRTVDLNFSLLRDIRERMPIRNHRKLLNSNSSK